MTQGQLTKNWTITPNVRDTFVSLNNSAAFWIFQNHTFLVARGWAVKYTCDGTTGPTSGSDHTDRLSAQNKCQTRGAAAGNAQSFSVLTSADGVDIMFTYQGATDDVIRISFSPGGLFTPAGTSNQQPTATDEVVLSVGTTVVNATASADRVMTMWGTNDATAWMCVNYRSSAVIFQFRLAKITPLVASISPAIFSPPYVGVRANLFERNGLPALTGPASINYDPSSTPVGTTGWIGAAARVFTSASSRITRCIYGAWCLSGTAGSSRGNNEVFTANTPALQNGFMPLALPFITGETTSANFDGLLGVAIDMWFAYSSSSLTTPAPGDFFPGYEPADVPGVDPQRTNWLVALGPTSVVPWRNAAVNLVIA
jgi:hypothetical protein